jgi:mitochondrial fission protein ELM1
MASAFLLNSGAPSKLPVVWLLLGNCVGDNNQLFALAEALGFPFEAKTISYNQLRHIPFLRTDLTIVARESRALIKPPWPDLVIGAGYACVPVARYIRRQSGGRTRIVHIGNPRGRIDDFDLQITTPQYAREGAHNLVALPFPIGNPAKAVQPTAEDLEWLRTFPRPRRLVAVGGPARHWQLDHAALGDAIRALQRETPPGSVIVATSPRTPRGTRHRLERLVSENHQVLVDHFPSFGVLLRESDEIHVTADSVSMLSEAILTGKPVGMIPIARSLRGRISHWLWERPMRRATLPDFANFWNLLRRRRLVGTVELPVASRVCDTVERAASAVRSLVAAGEAVDEGKAERAAAYMGPSRRPGWRQRSGDRPGGGAGIAVRDQATRI